MGEREICCSFGKMPQAATPSDLSTVHFTRQ